MRWLPTSSAQMKTHETSRTLKRRRRKKRQRRKSVSSEDVSSLVKEHESKDSQASHDTAGKQGHEEHDKMSDSSSGTTSTKAKSSESKSSLQTKPSSSVEDDLEEPKDLNIEPITNTADSENPGDPDDEEPIEPPPNEKETHPNANRYASFQVVSDGNTKSHETDQKVLSLYNETDKLNNHSDNQEGSRNIVNPQPRRPGVGMTSSISRKQRCKRSKSFNTTLLIEHDGEDMDKDTESLELLELGKAFLELYNTMNAPNKDPQRCDSKFRKIESVEVQAMGSFERVFEDHSYDVRRIHLYHITASCHGKCDSHTTLFDPEKKTKNLRNNNRQLGKDEEQSVIWHVDDSGNKNENESCVCDGRKKKMSPTVDEFVSEFTNLVSKLYYPKDKKKRVKTDATAATAIFELQEVQCKRPGDEDKFETTVYVDYEGDALQDLDKIESKMEVHLTRSFRYSYNELANLFCDPLQRKVEKVQITDEKLDRRLRKKGNRRRFKYRIKGRCKGCRRKTKLFQDTQPTLNRYLQGGPHDFIRLSGLDKSILGPAVERILKRDEEDDRCFCSRHPLTERAPTTHEFTFWYDQTRHLAEGVTVTSVVEIPK